MKNMILTVTADIHPDGGVYIYDGDEKMVCIGYLNTCDARYTIAGTEDKQNSSYIEISWNLPTRYKFGFSEVKLPAIYYVKVDFKKIADNWSDTSKVTTVTLDSNIYSPSKEDITVTK